MLENLPIYTTALFLFTVIVTIFWFYAATKSKKFLVIAIAWSVIQSIIALNGVYTNTSAMPPRIMVFGILPTLIFIVTMLVASWGKTLIDSINLETLTYFHSIRILVEICLVLLLQQKLVPVNMTLEGANFDLFSGITASPVAYFAFRTGNTNRKLLFWWNLLCLLLLLNVVITALLALPSPFQKIALEQPNIAVLYFPFSLLPTVIVPLVLFAHLAAFRRLSKK